MKHHLTALLLSSSLLFGQEEAQTKKVEELDPIVVESSPLSPPVSEATQAWSVLDGKKLDRARANTIGETLADEPGVSQSYFGPSASRPIIRGLDKHRVMVVENGVSSFDVSSASEDHAVPLDTMLVDRIEVLRGANALLYGGNAIGGVVNVIDRSIPTQSYAGSSGGSFLSSYSSVDKGWNAGASAYGGNDSFSFQINGLKKEYWEYDAPNGKVKNSMGDRSSIGFGGSRIMDNGYAGLSFSRYDSSYNIPGEHADSKSRIEAKRDRFEFRSEIQIAGSDWLQAVDVNIGYGDYEHSEIGLHGGAFETHSTFLREGWDGRIVMLHEVGNFNGALGFHGHLDDLKIVGEESIFGGASKPTAQNDPITSEESTKLGIFLIEEFDVNENTKANAGIRFDNIDRDFVGISDRDDSTFSASVGLDRELSEIWSLAGNLNYSERIPDSTELYSDGAHHATESWEVGSSDLSKEKARGVEIVLRRTSGKITGQLSGFYTKFNNYVFLEDTERNRIAGDGPLAGFYADAAGPDTILGNEDDVASDGSEVLPERKYEAAKAKFYGLELEIDWLALENPGWSLLVSAYGDTLTGKNETHGNNLPRTAPSRLGLGFEIQQEKFNYGVDLKRVFKQDKISSHAAGGGHSHGETATDAYTLINAFASYDLEVLDSQGQVFVRGYNLTDELAQVHTSFLKESAPLPGRSVEIGLKFDF